MFDFLFGSDKAKRLNKRAENNRDNAQKIYNDAKIRLGNKQKELESEFYRLGNEKKNTIDTSIARFLLAFRAFKNVELRTTGNYFEDSGKVFDMNTVMQLREMCFVSSSIGSTAAKGVASGALMSLAAGGALSTLGGVAGATAIGGFATAAGAALMSNPVTAVVGLLVGSWLSSSRQVDDAKHNLYASEEMLANAEAAAAQMDTAVMVMDSICLQCRYITGLNSTLENLLNKCVTLLEQVVYNRISVFGDGKIDYASLTQEEKNLIAVSRALAGALKAVIDMPILSDNGTVSEGSQNLLIEYDGNYIGKKNQQVALLSSYDYSSLAQPTMGNKLYHMLGYKLNNDLSKDNVSQGSMTSFIIGLIFAIAFIFVGMQFAGSEKGFFKDFSFSSNKNASKAVTQTVVKEEKKETPFRETIYRVSDKAKFEELLAKSDLSKLDKAILTNYLAVNSSTAEGKKIEEIINDGKAYDFSKKNTYPEFVYIKGDDVTLRKYPSTESEKLSSFNNNTKVKVLDLIEKNNESINLLKSDIKVDAYGKTVELKKGQPITVIGDRGEDTLCQFTAEDGNKYKALISNNNLEAIAGEKWYQIETEQGKGYVAGDLISEKMLEETKKEEAKVSGENANDSNMMVMKLNETPEEKFASYLNIYGSDLSSCEHTLRNYIDYGINGYITKPKVTRKRVTEIIQELNKLKQYFNSSTSQAPNTPLMKRAGNLYNASDALLSAAKMLDRALDHQIRKVGDYQAEYREARNYLKYYNSSMNAM